MSVASTARRLTYLTHRWLGVAGCLLMLAWFVSGVVMLFVGYPKLTPWERLAALPELDSASCCVSLVDEGGEGGGPGDQLVLTSVRGEPVYISRAPGAGFKVYPAGSPSSDAVARAAAHPRAAAAGTAGRALPGVPDVGSLPPVSANEALLEARQFSGRQGHYAGLVDEDRWTHSRGLDAHRPLHRIDIGGPSATTLYVSSQTGQVVMDAPLSQQRWNYIGAWLHWLYMFRSASVDSAWDWIIIILSALGTVSALTGVLVGVWRWRMRGRYKSGSHSPYREPWMKWHHIVGLLFSAFVCTWIFSGLMSVNPGGIFAAGKPGPDLRAYSAAATGDEHAPSQRSAAGMASLPMSAVSGMESLPASSTVDRQALRQPATILEILRQASFRPVELQWHRLAGRPYVLAYDAAARTRIVLLTRDTAAGAQAAADERAAEAHSRVPASQAGPETDDAKRSPPAEETSSPASTEKPAPEANPHEGMIVLRDFSAADILPAATRLFKAPMVAHSVITDYDPYYYQRHPEAMNGAQHYQLPALRADFADPGNTRVYIDLSTGRVARSLTSAQRTGRWLFYFLHSWDTPPLLDAGPLRDAILILLSLGGVIVTATGVVIGIRRLQRKSGVLNGLETAPASSARRASRER